MTRTTERRNGNVVVVCTVTLVGLLAVTALSLDGGLLLDKRRQAQAAADAAAYAAASELFASTFTNGGLDNGPTVANATAPPAGSIAAFAKQVAKENGFEDGVGGVTVTVNIPPLSGPFTGQKGHAEVIISAPQQRFFSTVFGSRAPVNYGARAVARGMRTTINNGIIVLNPTKDAAMTAGGGGIATVKGGASVIVNSNHPGGMNANGGTTVSATGGFDVSGIPGWVTSGGATFSGPIDSGVAPTPDPLRFIPQPDPSTLPIRSSKKIQHSGASVLELWPGRYIGGISSTGKGNIFLNPGIYYMDGGGFNIGGQGSLTGYEVMIYNDPKSNSDTISLAGQGAITLTPPTSGPYQGITLFQRRTGDPQPTLSVTGSGTAPLQITGTFYAAGAELSVTGNGTQDTIGSQYISDTLKLGGNGTFNVDWDPNVVPGIRQLWLVE